MATQNSKSEYKLNPQEIKFVAAYIETGNLKKAVQMAGYNTTSPGPYGRKLLAKRKIQEELNIQLSELRGEFIASNEEIMQFFTSAMRGEVKDQFGLDPTLADRMKAAEALAKRRIDMEVIADKCKAQEVKVKLYFGEEDSGGEE